MNISAIMSAATIGNPKRLRPMIIWTSLEYFFRGAPYGILIMVVLELLKPFQHHDLKLNIQLVWIYVIMLLISLVILFYVSKITYKKTFYETYDICAEGRISIGNHLRKLSMGFFNARDPGAIGAYLIDDYANVEFLLSHLIPHIFGAISMPLLLIFFLAFQNWQLALASAMVIPIAIPIAWISSKIIEYLGKKHQTVRIASASRMLEYLHGMRLIKAFNLTGNKFDRLEKTFRKLKSLSIKLEAGSGPTIILASFILHGGLTLIILLGLTFLFASTISLPAYIMFLIVGIRVYEPLIQVLGFFAELNYYRLSVERIEELRKTPVLTGTNPDIKPQKFDIEFENVSFSYQDTEILKNINIYIPENSLTAFVGPSGSGKTTMTRLIARFWDVSSGSIKLGGNNIKTYDPDDLLASISMVFQDVYLFNDTVVNNIKVGNHKANLHEVIQAAKSARCHDFIEKLPNGYETIVGEGGSTLSGGEKQRISIARAILKDAPIVLLDEATASLDPENELHIQEAINELINKKTVVIIAHRLNTVVKADNIFVLDNGRVVEHGTHDNLIKQHGLYRKMWEEQQKARSWKF